jgi:predicted nucleotidyltransferase
MLYYNGKHDRKTTGNPVLKRFRAAVTEIYGDRVERVVLFGSRARGDAREDSDYDVAVFLRDYAPAPRPSYTGWPTSAAPFS